MRGLMMGRFQPFHLGHLALVKQVLKECDEIVIAITGSQFNYIEKDPFTSGERIEMIHDTLKDEKLNLADCIIVAIENQLNNANWLAFLKSSLPKFDKIYSGNDYVSMLLGNSGVEVVVPKFLDRKMYNATKIRAMINQDESWAQYLPQAVSRIIKKIDGVNRIKTISKSDTKPQEF